MIHMLVSFSSLHQPGTVRLCVSISDIETRVGLSIKWTGSDVDGPHRANACCVDGSLPTDKQQDQVTKSSNRIKQHDQVTRPSNMIKAVHGIVPKVILL